MDKKEDVLKQLNKDLEKLNEIALKSFEKKESEEVFRLKKIVIEGKITI